MIGAVGRVGRLGLFGGSIRQVVRSADFTLTGASVATNWGTVVIGDLVPNAAAPAGAYFVIVGEPAGLAVVNG